MKVKWVTLFLLFGLAFTTGCSNNNKEKKDDILAGKLPVVVDETILPLFQEQKEVFESSYYNATIETSAKSEVAAINSLINGDAAMAVLTRKLNVAESKSFEQRSIKPRIFSFAYDAIVAVGNVADQDTGIVINDIIELMKGNKSTEFSLIFDNLNSSVLRQFRDIGKIEKVANTFVEAETSSETVLKKVATNRGKVGLISYNQYLSLESSFSEKDKIRILSVLNDKLPAPRYIKPSQASLATDEYPLKREVFVLNYQPNLGLGLGFSAFMTGDRGQRIVLKSGLLPITMPGREIIIRSNIK